MRYTFGKELHKLMKKDKKIILIYGDIGWGVFNDIWKEFPDRCFNVGICEQTMIGMAAGLALQGLKPVVYTITPFLIERAFEQIKIDVDSMKAKVMLCGYADYSEQGITHAEIDAEWLMSKFDNTINKFPKTEEEIISDMKECYEYDGPSFFSLKKLK